MLGERRQTEDRCHEISLHVESENTRNRRVNRTGSADAESRREIARGVKGEGVGNGIRGITAHHYLSFENEQ